MHHFYISIDFTFFEETRYFSHEKRHCLLSLINSPLWFSNLCLHSNLPSTWVWTCFPIQSFLSLPTYHLLVLTTLRKSISYSNVSTYLPKPPYDLPIALRKGNRSTLILIIFTIFLNYHHLSSSHYAFLFALSIYIPKTVDEALSCPRWR